ncbi:unnamed protein product [Calypogeia fissa]
MVLLIVARELRVAVQFWVRLLFQVMLLVKTVNTRNVFEPDPVAVWPELFAVFNVLKCLRDYKTKSGQILDGFEGLLLLEGRRNCVADLLLSLDIHLTVAQVSGRQACTVVEVCEVHFAGKESDRRKTVSG